MLCSDNSYLTFGNRRLLDKAFITPTLDSRLV